MPGSVAFVIDELEVGGSQRQLHLMATGLAARGWQVHVICLQPVLTFAAEFDQVGVPVHLLRKQRMLDFQLVRALGRFIEVQRIDLVHAFSSTAEFYGALGARAMGCRFVASIRTWSERLPILHRIAKRVAIALADAVVANSRAGRAEALASRLAAERKIHVVPNGINLKRFEVGEEDRRDARRRLGLPDDALVVILVGRLVVEKGYMTAIEIARRVTAAHPNSIFLAVGDGPLREQLDQRIRQAKLETRFVLLGERPDVRAVLAAADLYLNTSDREGMSNAIMEAMASALPVVASAVGGTPELVRDGKSGFLFPIGNVAIAAKTVGLLLTDPALRRTFGDRGRLAIEANHSAEAMVSRLESLYQGLLRRGDA